MEALREDLRHALRFALRRRSASLAALLTLALGLGVNTALFAVVYGVLLRPLPWPEADRLVRVWESHPGGRSAVPKLLLSNVTAEAWSEAPRTIEGLGGWSSSNYTLTLAGEPERVRGAALSPEIFRMLRARPLAGRFFTDAEGRPGGEPAVVLGAGLWRERFGADPGLVGRTVAIDGRGHQVVGIAPPDLAFPDADTRLYVPFEIAVEAGEGGGVPIRAFAALARLRPEATAAQAAAEGTAAARSRPRPVAAKMFFGEGGAPEVHARVLAEELTAGVRPALLVLVGGVLLLLLAACANVANLLLSETLARRRELAVRTALGATRGRVLQLLLTESLAIATAGGLLGLLLAWGIVRALPALAPADFPRLDDIRLDPWAVSFGLLLSLAAGALAGVVPALHGAGRELVPALRDAGGATSARAPRLRRGLLVVEAALCVVLLIGSGLLARSFARLLQVDAGYDPTNVLVAELVFPDVEGGPAGRRAGSRDSFLERLRATPGVIAVGAGNMVPFDPITMFGRADLPWRDPDGAPVVAQARIYAVTPGYSEALGLRLLGGRFFAGDDAHAMPRPVLVNAAFVRSYVHDGLPALGRRLKGVFSAPDELSEIVGVVGDVLKDGLDTEPRPEIYLPQADDDDELGMLSVVARVRSHPGALAAGLRSLARQVDPDLTLDRVGTLAARVSGSVARPRFSMAVLGVFAALSLSLAASGLYGVLSLAISERRRELSIRSALGAGRAELVGLVVRQGLGPTLAGLLVGVALAAALARLMARLLFGVTPWDALAFAAAPALLALVAGLACIVPARRAAAVDPAVALRSE